MEFSNDTIHFNESAERFSTEQLIAARSEIDAVLAMRTQAIPDTIGAVSVAKTTDIFARDEQITVEQGTSLAERLGSLPDSLRELTLARYEQRLKFTEKYLHDRLLSLRFKLPEMSIFIDRIESLVPMYEHMMANGMLPTIEFVPLGLDEQTWNGLFQHYDATGFGSERIFKSGVNERVHVSDPKDIEVQFAGSTYDVVLVDSRARPTVCSISRDGSHGIDIDVAHSILASLPTVDAGKAESIVTQATVTEVAYRAMQLSRVERGEKTVDQETSTIVRENVVLNDSVHAIWVSLPWKDRQVLSTSEFSYRYFYNAGPRVFASGSEIVARSSKA